MHRQMSQRRRSANNEKGDDVLFGVRALESGIEVEGVWISRPTTPETGSRQSSAGSLVLQRLQRRILDVDLEKGPAVSHERASSRSTTSSVRPGSSGGERGVSAERAPSSRASRDSSPSGPITKPLRTRHPPCSYSKYSSSPYIYRVSTTMSTLEGLEAIHKASTSLHADSSSGSSESSQGGNDNEPISASAPRLLNRPPAAVTKRRQQSADLDMLNSHRVSLAAEIGQLTPRGRKPGQSGDRSSTSLPASASTPTDQSDCFMVPHKLTQAPPPEGASSTNSLTTLKTDALPASIRRTSMPDVTPFAKFCQTAPPTPRPESSRPPSQASSSNVRPPSHCPSVYTSAPGSPIKPVPTSTTPSEPAEVELKRASFEKRQSRVIRGEGTGFEILKPGSLNPPPLAEHPMQRQRAVPPVSLHSGYQPRSTSADSRRKLQKKRRQSLDSQTSSDAGRKSRNSVL